MSSTVRAAGLAALAVAVLLIVGVVVGVAVPSDPLQVTETAAGEPPPTGDAPGPETVPTPTPESAPADEAPAPSATPDDEPEDFDALLDDLVAFVEAERGLEFRTRPEVELLADEAFVDRLLADFDEDVEEIEPYEGLYRAAGLIGLDDDLVEEVEALRGGGVVGFYDPESDELVVRAGEVTPFAETVIVHELVHALDDQWFDLDRPEYDDALDEVGYGFTAIAEGNARRIEDAYTATLPPAERRAAAEEEARAGAGVDVASIPFGLIWLTIRPYDAGRVLVEEILAADGQERLDEAFESPPTTSEQVERPEAFLDGEGAVPVDPPPADGEVTEEGIFGEVAIQAMLGPVLGLAPAMDAASGWGGDWFVSWDDGDRTCIRVDFAMDTPADTGELREALAGFVEAMPDAEVEALDDLTRLTSCA